MRYLLLAITWIIGAAFSYFFAWKPTRPKDEVYFGADRTFGIFFCTAFSWLAYVFLWLDWLYERFLQPYEDKPAKW